MKNIRTKTISLVLCIAMLLSCIVISQALSQAIGLGTITSSDVILRAQASDDAKTIIFLNKDCIVNVVEDAGSYYRVNYAGCNGYVPKQYCSFVAAPCTFNLEGHVTESGINVRSSRSTSSTIVGTVNSNATAVALEDGWFTIFYGGKEAYIRSDYFYITEYGEITEKAAEKETDNSKTTATDVATATTETTKKEETKKTETKTTSVKETPKGKVEPTVSTPTALVTKSHVQIKAGATNSSKTIGHLERYESVVLTDGKDYNGWMLISFGDIKGYVPTDVLLIKEEESEKEEETKTEETKEEPEKKSSSSNSKVLGIGIVNDKSKIYEKPATDSSSVLEINANTVVAVLGKENDWYHVTYNGKEGYLPSSSLEYKEGTCDLSTFGYIKADELNVRSSASTSAKKVTTVKKGVFVDVTGFDNGWFKISYNSSVGFVSGDYINLTDTKLEASPEPKEEQKKEESTVATIGSGTGADIAAYALQFEGTRYVYGGSSPSGFDCSGFTMYIFSQYNIALPHGATPQLKYGTEVSKSNLSAGDLVFFQDSNLSSSTSSHVGIYIGNNQFIHASSSTGYCVKISSLDESYYSSHYLTARRIVQ